MRRTIVLSGDCKDAAKAADWAKSQATRAHFGEEVAETLRERVLSAYHAACVAFFDGADARQMLMLCLDLRKPTPQFELISDGEQARGTVSAAQGLGLGQRQRNGLLDGLTCVSIPA